MNAMFSAADLDRLPWLPDERTQADGKRKGAAGPWALAAALLAAAAISAANGQAGSRDPSILVARLPPPRLSASQAVEAQAADQMEIILTRRLAQELGACELFLADGAACHSEGAPVAPS